MLSIAVARSSSGGVTKSQGEGTILAGFFPTDNAYYSIAFGIHTKTAALMSFGLMTLVGPKFHVLDGGPDPQGKREFFRGGRGNVAAHCKVIGHSMMRCAKR